MLKITLSNNPDAWKNLRFMVFDIPSIPEIFEERYKFLCKMQLASTIAVVTQSVCKNREHLYEIWKKIVYNGGEGVVLKNPNKKYTPFSNGQVSWKLKVFCAEY